MNRRVVPKQRVLHNKAIVVTADVGVLIRQVVPMGYRLRCYL